MTREETLKNIRLNLVTAYQNKYGFPTFEKLVEIQATAVELADLFEPEARSL